MKTWPVHRTGCVLPKPRSGALLRKLAKQCLRVRAVLSSGHATKPEMQPLGSSASVAGHRRNAVSGPNCTTCAAGSCSPAASAARPRSPPGRGSIAVAAGESRRAVPVSAAASFAGRGGELCMLGGCGAGTDEIRYGSVSSLVWTLCCFFTSHPDERRMSCGVRVFGMRAEPRLAMQPPCVQFNDDVAGTRLYQHRAARGRVYQPWPGRAQHELTKFVCMLCVSERW